MMPSGGYARYIDHLHKGWGQALLSLISTLCGCCKNHHAPRRGGILLTACKSHISHGHSAYNLRVR